MGAERAREPKCPISLPPENMAPCPTSCQQIARVEKQISERNRRNNLTTGFWVSLVVFGTCLAVACLFFVKAVEAIQLVYIATAFFGCSFLLVFIVLPTRKL